ncbi:MAG: hypothetical protein R8L07_03540 [Alphaproteobacteria bacterium]|nr:hypothetical protein [Alphaproteobacteria bacterium]
MKARSLIVLNAIQDIHAAGKRADYGSVVRATGQSKMTIQRALGDLTGAGLIETQGGRGTRGGMRFLPVESGVTKETGQCT